ncbi:response regulator [Myxococcaceae bacterium GXIMD 01537]
MHSILFVDADPRQLSALRRLTRELSGTRRFAQDAEEALALIAAEVPSLLVSGYRLPGMDGLELLESVRAHHPGVTCALHTACPPGRLRRDSGITVLDKPTPPGALLAFLRTGGRGGA